MGSPYLIGIAGASCSGKTTLAKHLAGLLPAGETEQVALDSYYYDLSHLSTDAIGRHNLDEPAALESQLLFDHVQALASGQSIDLPVYDHKTHSRAPVPRRVEPRAFVIFEGLFALYWREVREYLDRRVFIDASHDVCLGRRIDRDRNQRGRTVEEVTRRYRQAVQPMFDLHVLPTRAFADTIVDGLSSIEESAQAILSRIREQDGKR